jgi:hypothetical protein
VEGQALEARLGKFAVIPEGAQLRTAKGRAEVLLTPGVLLRVGDDSAIRMIASALPDTRVELVAGSAILDSLEPGPGTSVTLVYKGWNIRQPQKGVYRIDSNPPRLHVREGEVEVAAAGGGTPVTIGPGMDLPLAAVLAPDPSSGEAHDTLSEWSAGRAESISADNAIAANIQDPATMSGPGSLADSFTYFPMLGLPTFGSAFSGTGGSLDPYASSVYGLSNPYQVGFYSIYLPGYTRRPLLLGLPSVGLTRSLYGPSPFGSRFPVIGSPGLYTGAPGLHYPILHPPAVHPVTPAPAPHGPAHIGGHR